MLYRELGKTKEKVSILSFGAMRLPHFKTNDQIDKEKTEQILKYGIENGINLIDTGYSYHAEDLAQKGNCEPYIGNFLKENSYRENVLISAKLPTWLVNKKEDMESFLNEQLKRLETDSIDIYLLHTLTADYWKMYKDNNVFEFMDTILSDGRVKHIGFSSHTEFDTLVEIIDDYDKWEVALTQMNYLDENYQSGINGLNYISDCGLANMIMEPLRGGRLVQNIPKDIENLWNTSKVKRTPVEWALKYLWNMENVSTVISGMNTIEQVKENIKIASMTKANSLSNNELELIKTVAKAYHSKKGNDCTGCQYCMPCPNKVDIPKCFKEYNIARMLDDPAGSAMQYFSSVEEEERPNNCNNCKECIPHCPQMINIPEELKKVHSLFGEKYTYF